MNVHKEITVLWLMVTFVVVFGAFPVKKTGASISITKLGPMYIHNKAIDYFKLKLLNSYFCS